MIKCLKLKNYILIDELEANFDLGLNIITGETGAGKSILINAIELVFSQRVSKDVIKSGEDRAFIELVIECSGFKTLLADNDIEDLGNEIIISKEVTQNSVRSRINGTVVNSDLLKIFREKLIDIHSQHQTYAYMQPKFHINLLDSYGKSYYGTKLDEYKKLYSEYVNLEKELEIAKNSAEVTESQLDFLKFQINEIESAQIKSNDEDERLSGELKILENSEKLKELTGSSYWALKGDDGSICDALSKIKQNLSKASSLNSELEEIEQTFTDACELLSNVGSGLNSYSQNLENDYERLNEIQERLFLFDKLKRKYGNTLSEVLTSYEGFCKELEKIEVSSTNIDSLLIKITDIKEKLLGLANEISENRKNFAKVLSNQIQDKLTFLELPKSRFEISVKEKSLSSDGIDDVEFMISTNISQDLMPLAKVASGGEISRVMLAIKSIFAENDNIDTVIFDEIDTGISGKASQSVAEEISNLSKFHQIILITHQAIIASKADKHFYVKKSQCDETKVDVYVLKDDDRVKALAELAGGTINEQSVDFAKSLLYESV